MSRSHPVDVHVGARMRQRRSLLGMSQTNLGTAVGLTFQQIQKYERGTNRIGSSRLKKVATVLGVGVGTLFAESDGDDQWGRDPLTEITSQPHAARLLKAFAGITDEKLRLALVKLAEGLQERAK